MNSELRIKESATGTPTALRFAAGNPYTPTFFGGLPPLTGTPVALQFATGYPYGSANASPPPTPLFPYHRLIT